MLPLSIRRPILLLIAILSVILPQTAHAQGDVTIGAVDFAKLSDQIDNYLQVQKFVPGTTRQGGVYVADLKYGQTLTINPDVIFSGVSMTKIAVLLAVYHEFPTPLDQPTAILVAKMMLCSDNAATNALMKMLGKGDIEKGAALVTFVVDLFSEGKRSFLLRRAYSDDGTPTITGGSVDLHSADADPYNQVLPQTLGELLARIYHCAQSEAENNSTDGFYGLPTTAGCRHMLRLMRANHIGALIEGGVPASVKIAHKQGWSDDTHGDVAIINTPGGDYVLVIALHQRTWLNYKGSFPVMAEVSRMVYNAYNPKASLTAIRSQPIPKECPLDPAVIADLQDANAPPL